jgi:hypothetical protein
VQGAALTVEGRGLCPHPNALYEVLIPTPLLVFRAWGYRMRMPVVVRHHRALFHDRRQPCRAAGFITEGSLQHGNAAILGGDRACRPAELRPKPQPKPKA